MPVVVVVAGVALDVVEVLVILMVAWFASLLLIKPLTWLISQVPVVGQQIAQALENGVGAMEQWMQQQAKNSLAPLVAIVSAPVHWLQSVIGQAVTAAESIVAQLVAMVQSVLQLAARVSLALSNIAGELGSLAARIAALWSALATTAYRVASALIAVAESRLRALIAGVSASIPVLDRILRAVIASEVAKVVSLITATDHALRLLLATTVATLRHEWATDLAPIQRGLDVALPVTTAVTAVGVIPFVAEWATELPRIVDECVKPGCSALGPSLDWLNALNEGATLAAMVALMSAATNDPEGTAGTIVGAVNGVDRALSGILGGIVPTVGP